MPKVRCPRHSCTFETGDVEAVIVAALLHAHVGEHASHPVTLTVGEVVTVHGLHLLIDQRSSPRVTKLSGTYSNRGGVHSNLQPILFLIRLFTNS